VVFNKRLINNLKLNSLPLGMIKDIEVKTVPSEVPQYFFSLFENYKYIALFLFLVFSIYVYLNYLYGKIYFSLKNIFNYNSVVICYDNYILPTMVGKYEEPECLFKCYCSKIFNCPLSEFNKQIKISVEKEKGEVLYEEITTNFEFNIKYVNDTLIIKDIYCNQPSIHCKEKPIDSNIKYCPKCKYRFIYKLDSRDKK
jgi:hypothetical protein